LAILAQLLQLMLPYAGAHAAETHASVCHAGAAGSTQNDHGDPGQPGCLACPVCQAAARLTPLPPAPPEFSVPVAAYAAAFDRPRAEPGIRETLVAEAAAPRGPPVETGYQG
jgi:hypothetical protein